MTLEPTPDHAALLRLLTLSERDMPEVLGAVRSIHSRYGNGTQLQRVEFARTLVRQMSMELGGIEHLLDLTIERIDP
jgi:hypothetical protein